MNKRFLMLFIGLLSCSLTLPACKPMTAHKESQLASNKTYTSGVYGLVNCGSLTASFVLDSQLNVTELKLSGRLTYMEKEGAFTVVAANPYFIPNDLDAAKLISAKDASVNVNFNDGSTKQFPLKNFSLSNPAVPQGQAYVFVDDAEQQNQDVVLAHGENCTFENMELLNRLH